MKHHWRLFSVVFTFSLIGVVAAQENVERKPLSIGTKIEMGQIVDGEPNKTGEDPDKSNLSRMAVSLTQEVTVDHRLEIKAGVGGVFYSVFPDVRGQPGSQGIKFGPGITQAQAAYKFGQDPQKPFAIFRAGFFPYKYNPDAKNLGEYLLRSMPYPTFTFTGSWSITDAAFTRAQGLQATVFNLDGKLKHDFLITTERDFRPAGNFTPSYLTEFTAGPFQVGAGVSFFHLFPLDRDRLKSKDMGPYTVYRYDSAPAFTLANNPNNGNPMPTPYTHEAGASLYVTQSELDAVVFENPGIDTLLGTRDTVEYQTNGTKLMARGSFSIQKIVPMDFLNPQDLKVYAEVALLGTKNQPVYFEKRAERVPVMVGVNLPTFKMLDYLSLEVEYFGSPLPDDYEQVLINNYPIYEGYGTMLHSSKNNRDDDWKWSLYASKTLATGLSIRAQVANDHLRSIDQATNTFSGQSLMRDPSNWYYVIALNFGI